MTLEMVVMGLRSVKHCWLKSVCGFRHYVVNPKHVLKNRLFCGYCPTHALKTGRCAATIQHCGIFFIQFT